jgi:hypothetical protein
MFDIVPPATVRDGHFSKIHTPDIWILQYFFKNTNYTRFGGIIAELKRGGPRRTVILLK